MSKKTRPGRPTQNTLVGALLRLPATNLESRIAQLESELGKRQQLSNQILCDLGTKQLRLKNQIWRLRYAMPESQAAKSRDILTGELSRIAGLRHKELLDQFRDHWQLDEKLMQVHEDLTLETQKMRLLEDNLENGRYR